MPLELRLSWTIVVLVVLDCGFVAATPAPQVDFFPFLTQVYFKPFTIFVAPTGEQIAPGFGGVNAEVELTVSASTKTLDAEIVANRFKRCLLL